MSPLIHRLVSLSGTLLFVLVLAACEVSTPSRVHIGKIIIQDQMVAEAVTARPLDQGRINVLSDNFMRRGKGQIVLNVPYLSEDAVSKEMAERASDSYKTAFEKRGISRVSVVMVPVAEGKYTDKIVVTYNSLAAVPSKDCHDFPGRQGADDMEAVNQYQFGCGVQTGLSKMIANPSDLMGHGGIQNNDSRRSGTVIETYKAGTPNSQMKGYSASGVGG